MQLAAEDYAIDPPKQMQFAAEVRAILHPGQWTDSYLQKGQGGINLSRENSLG